MAAQTQIVLEPAAQEFADASSNPPFLYELDYPAARKVLDDVQAAPVEKLPIDEEWITVPASVGDARVRIIRPEGAEGALPAILYTHGGGWVLGNAGTHDRLVRELAVGANAGLAFVEYPNSPEGRYPVAIEQGYATAQWIMSEGASKGLDGSRIAVAGDSVGGNMTAARVPWSAPLDRFLSSSTSEHPNHTQHHTKGGSTHEHRNHQGRFRARCTKARRSNLPSTVRLPAQL